MALSEAILKALLAPVLDLTASRQSAKQDDAYKHQGERDDSPTYAFIQCIGFNNIHPLHFSINKARAYSSSGTEREWEYSIPAVATAISTISIKTIRLEIKLVKLITTPSPTSLDDP